MNIKCEQAIDILFTAAIVGVGLLSGNPVIASVVGGIGINWAADLTREGWRQARCRLDLLADLRALAPVFAALGGAGAATETARAIQDVGRWWP